MTIDEAIRLLRRVKKERRIPPGPIGDKIKDCDICKKAIVFCECLQCPEDNEEEED